MTNFHPGKKIKQFKTKDNQQVVIRYPRWDDFDQLLEYINNLSQENTFINYSGEEITKKEETKFLSEVFKNIELNNQVNLLAFVEGELAGGASLERKTDNRERSKHVAVFRIAIAKKYRGQGIGEQLAKTVVEEGKEELSWLKLIVLHVFSNNHIAQNLYQKLGFKNAGMLPKAVHYKGEYQGDIRMYLEV